MSKPSMLKPGHVVPRSGQYQQLGPRGGVVREITAVKGEVMPPTPKPNMSYRLVDATKNKSGRG